MPNERPDATSKTEVDDRSQAISSSTQELSSTLWQEMRTPAKQLDTQPQRFNLTETSTTTASDAQLSIRTGVKPGAETLPALELFDSADSNGQGSKSSLDTKPGPAKASDAAPASDAKSKASEMKWETYSASYVGENIDWGSYSNQKPAVSGANK